MVKRFTFTDSELKALAESPDALRSLSAWHAINFVMTDSPYHFERAYALRAESERLEVIYNRNERPKFED